MGCCVSTSKHPPSSIFHRHLSRSSRAPPVVDVETVKEVLSETPNASPFIKIQDNPKSNSFKFRLEDHVLEDPIISDICSTMSENISTATFDDDDNRQKAIMRSPVKSGSRRLVSGEFQPLRKSPVRGNEHSPGRVKFVPERSGREPGFGSGGRQRPGSGNIPSARSRSPAKRTVAGGSDGSRNEIGRSLSGRRTGKSPGRVGSDLHERVRKSELRSGVGRIESGRLQTSTSKDESLENPLVSLECFIFL
ncbi:hypothetical protein R6Q59_016655 [Mikania micrantha]